MKKWLHLAWYCKISKIQTLRPLKPPQICLFWSYLSSISPQISIILTTTLMHLLSASLLLLASHTMSHLILPTTPLKIFTVTYKWRNGTEKFSYLSKSNSWQWIQDLRHSRTDVLNHYAPQSFIATCALCCKTYGGLSLVSVIRNYTPWKSQTGFISQPQYN